MTRLTTAIGIPSIALALLASLNCGSSSSVTATPPAAPPPPPNQDSTSVVIGSTGGVVVVPTGAAGVQIPPGVLPQGTTVTVSRLPTNATPGAGPLPTTLKQYPPYYEISTSPATPQLGDFVRVGVCQVSDPSSPFYPPEATHPRLRLAHRVGTSIEILEPVDVSDFLRCTGVSASAASTQPGFGFAGSLVSRLLAAISPKDAFAAHGGLGGKVKSFSPFAGVDPGPGNTATVFPMSPRAGFLLVDPQDSQAEPPLIIDLAALGFVAGDLVRLQPLGDFKFQTSGPETGAAMNAVFSSTNVLLAPGIRNRVPGAIASGQPALVTVPTLPNNVDTDIPEDFSVNSASSPIRIPAGARYLFVGVPDPYLGDNVDSDGNFAIRVSPVTS